MISTSLVSFFASTILGAVFKLIAVKMEYNKQIEEAKLVALNAKAKITEEARKYDNKFFQITRRAIALICVICIIAVPILYPVVVSLVWPEEFLLVAPDINLCYNELKSGFWPFTSDATVTVCKQLKGITITAFHADVIMSIIGLYFGSTIARGKS